MEATNSVWPALQALLLTIGLCVTPVEGDGNCLFRAISMAIYATEARHAEVRTAICDYMLNNRGVYAGVLGADDFAAYVAALRTPVVDGIGQYGSGLEIETAERIFKRKIEVYTTDFGIVPLPRGSHLLRYSEGDVICIVLAQEHYNYAATSAAFEEWQSEKLTQEILSMFSDDEDESETIVQEVLNTSCPVYVDASTHAQWPHNMPTAWLLAQQEALRSLEKPAGRPKDAPAPRAARSSTPLAPTPQLAQTRSRYVEDDSAGWPWMSPLHIIDTIDISDADRRSCPHATWRRPAEAEREPISRPPTAAKPKKSRKIDTHEITPTAQFWRAAIHAARQERDILSRRNRRSTAPPRPPLSPTAKATGPRRCALLRLILLAVIYYACAAAPPRTVFPPLISTIIPLAHIIRSPPFSLFPSGRARRSRRRHTLDDTRRLAVQPRRLVVGDYIRLQDLVTQTWLNGLCGLVIEGQTSQLSRPRVQIGDNTYRPHIKNTVRALHLGDNASLANPPASICYTCTRRF